MSSVSDKSCFRWLPALLAAILWMAPASGRQDALAAGDSEPPKAQRTKTVFRGNTIKSAADLRKAAAEELADFEQNGQRTWYADDAAFQMEQAYRRSGFAFARVDYEATHQAQETTLVFMIDEGPRVLVRHILLTGNEAFSSEELLPYLHGKNAGLLASAEPPFVKADVEAAISSIHDLYRERGFMHATIDEPQYVFAVDRTWVDIHVNIHEGTRYEVQDIEVQGDIPAEARSALDDLRRETLGQAYTGRTPLIVRARILEIYGNLGYADAVVDLTEQEEVEAGRMRLEATVAQGPRITIEEIRVQGNVRTRENFILQRLKLKAGGPYSSALEKESFRELYKAGLFSKVSIDLEKTNVEDQRILVVTVEEAPSLEVYFQPGWGSYEKLRLIAGVRQKNLFGTGRSWNSEALGAIKAQRFSTGLSDPWFLGYDLRADLTGFVGRREEPSFTRKDLGATYSLTKELSANLTGIAAATFRRTDVSQTDANIQTENIQDDYDYSSLKAQLTYDTRNDVFFPTSGQRLFGAAEHANTWLGGDVTLTRLTGGSRFFYRLASSTVLGLRYSTGLILPGEKEFTVPLAERFFNGGENTVRSFKESELGPKDSSNKPVGGLSYNVISVEVRQRLIGNFIGTVFADFGNVAPNRTREEEGKPPYHSRSQIISETLNDFLRGFRPGVGFGMQYLLPVGPVRLDIAFNPDRNTHRDEDLYVIHFSVGMAF